MFFWLFLFYFLNYILLIMVLQLSQFFPLWSPSPSTPHSLRQAPHHCSCPRAIRISSLATPFPTLYFTSPWLFCNYLFVLLNTLTSSSFSYTPSYLATIKMLSHVHDSVSVLLDSLACFLDSIVDNYVFFAILLFIVLIFFILNKSL